MAERKNAGRGGAAIVEGPDHGCVEGGDVVIGGYMGMQDGDIAKSDKPFGFYRKGVEVDVIDDTTEAIAAAAEEDSVRIWIIEEALQVGQAFPVGAGEIVVRHSAQGLAGNDVE